MRPKKLILVTSEAHPLNKAFQNVAESVSKELGIEKEVRIEDYTFLADHGEKDEFGMPWLPQLFVEMDNGNIYPVLTNLPFDSNLKPNEEEGKKEALNKIKNLTS